jgi:hypothetical protein
MTKKLIIISILGILVALLGLLWFLQGAEIVHLNPILCFSDCVPLTGKSLSWQVIGAVTFLVGIVTVVFCTRQAKPQNKIK